MLERSKHDYLPAMPKMEKQILELIYKMGTIKTNQISRILQVKDSQKDSFMYFINDLYNAKDRIAITDDGFVHVPEIKEINRNTTECIWEIIHNIEHVDLDLLDVAEKPADYFYTFDTTRTICDTFIDADSLYKIETLQERYYARQIVHKDDGTEDPDNGIMNVLVVNSMDVAQMIVDYYNITMPCKICFVEHREDSPLPNIHYYSTT